MSRAPLPLAVVILLGLGGTTTKANAYPIFVRAASQIELVMEHEGTAMRIVGRLRRDDTSPIPGARIGLSVGPREAMPLATDGEGRFVWSAEMPFGEYQVTAQYEGSAEVDGASETRSFTFGKSDVALDLALPARIDRSRPTVELEVRAQSGIGAAGLEVTLSTSEGRPLAQATTDAAGLARLTVVPRLLGAPGPLRLETRSAPDALRSSGHARAETMLVARSRLDLGPVPPEVPANADLMVTGRLSDEDRPIPAGAVEVRAGDGPVVRTATDARGVFAATVPFEGMPAGATPLVVRYRPDAEWRSEVTLGPYALEHLPPSPLPVGVVLIPAVVTALAIGLALRGARTRRRVVAPRSPPAHAKGGLSPSRPSSPAGRASRRPADAEITGRVWDPTQRRAVSGAHLRIGAGDAPVVLACDDAGRFATGPLPLGAVRVEVEAPGYEPQSFDATLPHHGELRDMRVDLIPIRHRVMEVYRDAAIGVLPERALWGFWTPRELIRFIRSRSETRLAPLSPLTDLFEEVYYAGRGATAAQLARAREIAVILSTQGGARTHQ